MSAFDVVPLDLLDHSRMHAISTAWVVFYR